MSERPLAIVIASMIGVVIGILVLVDAISKVLLMIELSVTGFFFLWFAVMVLVIQGILGIVAGIGLWFMKKWSGVLSILSALLNLFLGVAHLPGGITVIANVGLIGLIIHSWNKLYKLPD